MRARTAFSLVELMFAIALSLVIIVLAIAAVRSAAQSVAHIQRNSAQNALIRSGWFAALDDVDFWNSHANPEYPWLKGPMSDAVAIAGDTNNPWDKRAFRRVVWQGPNAPGRLLPHQLESWYRNGPLPGPMPRVRVPPRYELMLFLVSGGDPTTDVQRDPRKFFVPAGWAPWHVQGDYSVVSNVTDDGTRPATQLAVFAELGHQGVYAYLPPGTPNLVLRPSTNRLTANIGDRATWYDWGEVPWSLAVPASGPFSPTSVAVPAAAQVARHQRLNYILGLPGSPRTNYVTYATDIDDEVMAAYGNAASTPSKFWLTDLELTTGGVSRPSGAFLGNRALLSADGTQFDTDALIDSTTLDPWRSLQDTALATQAQPDLALMAGRFASRTFHLPQAPTDAPMPDLAQRPTGSAALATAILRVRHAGADRAWLSVLVLDPESGQRIELPFTALGTTFRGARQHWGWKTAVDRPALKPMGDVHAP